MDAMTAAWPTENGEPRIRQKRRESQRSGSGWTAVSHGTIMTVLTGGPDRDERRGENLRYLQVQPIPYIRDDDGEPIEGDWWVGDEYDDYESECYPNLRDGAAIAWMPLPEPYRAERRTDGANANA